MWVDFYDAFGSAAAKSRQDHLDSLCYLSANMIAAQAKFPVVRGIEWSSPPVLICVDCGRILLGRKHVLRRLQVLLRPGLLTCYIATWEADLMCSPCKIP
jgi:hypothetical protein